MQFTQEIHFCNISLHTRQMIIFNKVTFFGSSWSFRSVVKGNCSRLCSMPFVPCFTAFFDLLASLGQKGLMIVTLG